MDNNLIKNGHVNSVYEESPYGILVFNSALEVMDWNPAVEKLIGLGRDACMGKKLLEVFPFVSAQTHNNVSELKGTMVVAEAISGYFLTGVLNGLKISIIVDKSGAVNGGTLILTSRITAN